MSKYFLINLNQGESKEARFERLQERNRWFVFGFVVFLFLILNGGLLYINFGYSSLINQKMSENDQINEQLQALQAKGKNIAKQDIIQLAKIEEDRFMWARNMELLGELTPDDIAITGIQFKHNKWTIQGIASVYEDVKDFDIVNNYVNKLRNNKELSSNFSRIKFTEYSRQNFRGQDIINFIVTASVKSNQKSKKDKK